uniref:Major facilitator superfamily (MFS) profile domain-containing protein n=1 Tax=Plectus sambesii TaxID=2011161 RepID=A0A914XFV0_9BILA
MLAPGMKSAPSASSEVDDHFSMEKLWTKTETRLWTINLFIGTLTVYAARIVLPICSIAVAKEYDFNKADSGIVLSCFFWGYASTQIIGGYLADNYGGERVLVVSTLFWAITTCVTPQLFDLAAWMGQPLFILIIVRVAKGVSQGFHYPCMASIISRHLTSADKGRVFGICMAGSHAGTVLAGSIGSILLDMFGWRVVFYFIGSLGVLWWFYLQQSIALSTRRVTDGKPAVMLPLLHSKSESNLLTAAVGEPKKMLPINRSVPWRTLFSKPAF